MKKLLTLSLLLLLASFCFAQDDFEVKGEVTVHETENNGKYFSYVIVNQGEEVLEGGTYRVFLKVNKKNISFDRNTSDLKPGEAVRYESNHIFTKDDKTQELDYVLELVTQKPRRRHQLEEGTVALE
jgi:uncharacterized cupredoxin-like copper-binding protein